MDFRIAAALMALLAAACARESRTAEAPAASAAAGVKLHVIDCGSIDIKDFAAFSDEGAFDGLAGTAVVPCFLIRHPDGDLMWDAGLPASLVESGPTGEGGFTTSLARTIEDQLAELGLKPADIEFFAMSHSHFDHSGQAATFAGSTWLVDPAEFEWMYKEETAASGLVVPALLEAMKTAPRRDVTEDLDLFGDGKVRLVRTPGHTPGHMSLLVRLDKAGPVLLTGDLYHLPRSRTERRVPTFNVDRAMTLASMDKFEALATETGARVVIQHVAGDVAGLPAFPNALE
ncbi:MAG: N-acyl homoserine lactonase family protein [Parvularculaceae bacterium]